MPYRIVRESRQWYSIKVRLTDEEYDNIKELVNSGDIVIIADDLAQVRDILDNPEIITVEPE
jgi:uncharacterized NAD(P)/FAD-binding protein YdhS